MVSDNNKEQDQTLPLCDGGVTEDEEEDGSGNDDDGNDDGDDDDDRDHDGGEEKERLRPGRPPTGLSDYELLRLRNIERNNTRLASLGLSGGGESYQTGSEAEAAERGGRGRRGRGEGPRRSRIGSTATSAVASLDVEAQSTPMRRSTRLRRGGGGASESSLTASAAAKESADDAAVDTETNIEERFTVSPVVLYAMTSDFAAANGDGNGDGNGDTDGNVECGNDRDGARSIEGGAVVDGGGGRRQHPPQPSGGE